MDNINRSFDLIREKIMNLNNINELKAEQKCRIKYIEKHMNDLIDMLENLELSFLKDNNILSDEIKYKINENIKVDEIINIFTPLILAYSINNNI